MKATLILLFTFYCKFSFCQPDRCQILTELLNNPNAQFTFSLDKKTNLPIIFIDTGKLFENCITDKFRGREVEVLHDSAYLNKTEVSYIIIHRIETVANKCRIVVQHKNSGAYGFIYLKKRKNKFLISKYDMGYI